MRIVGIVLALVTALVAGCSALVQPDTTRLNGNDAGGAMMSIDVGRIDLGLHYRDTGSVVGDDAAMTGCPAPCTGGTACDGTSCVCPVGACCPGCAQGSVCIDGGCVQCGRPSDPCCDGAGCVSGATCAGGSCVPCGLAGDACCDGGACASGGICNGVTCDACGTDGQLCCAGARCTGTAVCGPDGRCHGGAGCGDAMQACCPGSTCNSAELACAGGLPPLGASTCQPCGLAIGQPCCAGNTCRDSMLVCGFRGCTGCGGLGQPCCAGHQCRDGHQCRSPSNYCG